jgi:CubicO group peptidase (beta-lactamase class C family)/uncharacterized protein YneR
MTRLLQLFLLLIGIGVSSTVSSQDFSTLDPYLDAMVEQKKFIGSVLVAQGDSIVYNKGFGPASADGSKMNTPESQFLIGSITKTFTAIAIMQLFEEEKLSLSDPLSKYVPLFPQSDQITIRHLLSHKSGIKNYTELPDMNEWKADEISPIRLVEKVMDYPLGFEPGTMFSYSNTNYLLLGMIIEQVTGMDYEKYLQKNILNRAGLSHTGMNQKKAKNLSEGLDLVDDEWQKADIVDVSVPFSAGALYSSTGDMLTFSKAFFNAEFFESKSTYELMTNFDEGSYGLGVYVEQIDEQFFIGHNGGIDGFSSTWHYFYELDLHAIVLSNTMSSRNDEVMDAIIHAQQEKEIAIPKPKEAIALSQEKLETLTGIYELQKGFNLTIFIEEGKLLGQATGQGSIELFAENDSTFFAKVVEIEVIFHQEGNEKAQALTLYQGGGATKAPRIEESRTAIKLEVADLEVLEGTYVLQKGFEIRIFTEEEKLMGQATGQDSFELFAENRQDFFTKGLGIEISFVFDEKGETKSLTLFQGGGKYDAEKRLP